MLSPRDVAVNGRLPEACHQAYDIANVIPARCNESEYMSFRVATKLDTVTFNSCCSSIRPVYLRPSRRPVSRNVPRILCMCGGGTAFNPYQRRISESSTFEILSKAACHSGCPLLCLAEPRGHNHHQE